MSLAFATPINPSQFKNTNVATTIKTAVFNTVENIKNWNQCKPQGHSELIKIL